MRAGGQPTPLQLGGGRNDPPQAMANGRLIAGATASWQLEHGGLIVLFHARLQFRGSNSAALRARDGLNRVRQVTVPESGIARPVSGMSCLSPRRSSPASCLRAARRGSSLKPLSLLAPSSRNGSSSSAISSGGKAARAVSRCGFASTTAPSASPGACRTHPFAGSGSSRSCPRRPAS